MKARIKETGEIINIADYATITLNKCDSWGNPIEVRPEDIELIQKVSDDEYWQKVREKAAIAAMQGLIPIIRHLVKAEKISKEAVEIADELVKQLKGE